MPLLYSVHGAQRSHFSLEMLLDPARVLVAWRATLSRSEPAKESLSFAMVRADGAPLASWPLPKYSKYDQTLPHDESASVPSAAVVGYFHEPGQQRRTNTFESYLGRRMASFSPVGGTYVGDYPAFIGASVLRTAVVVAWWRGFALILVGGLLLLAGLYFGIELLRNAEQRVDFLQDLRTQELVQDARVDHLTRLPNRTAFTEHLDEAFARADRGGSSFAVGILDLDDFKLINDRFGHAVGDVALVSIAERLRVGLRTCDYVARLGGDEFALILDNVASECEIDKPLQRLGEAFAAPIALKSGDSALISCSLGVSIYPLDLSDRDLLLHHADCAMYQVKARKGARGSFWQLYDGVPGIVDEPRREWSALISGGGLRLCYQPIVDVRDGSTIAVEALARLAEGSTLHSPAAFLPYLGLDGLRLLTESVLVAAFDDMQNWNKAGYPIGVSVNVPAGVLVADNFVHFLKGLLERSRIDPWRVTLEILESDAFRSAQLTRLQLARVKDLGVRLSLDDVGTAYSSLLRLKQLPVDEVKLSQEFVSDLFIEPRNLAYVMALQSLAANLNLTFVAEGVENYEIADAMFVLGVDCVQGFGISRPIPQPDLLGWFECGHRFETSGVPQTLLGAYAAHRVGHERIRRSWGEISKQTRADFQNCRMGLFLTRAGGSYAPVVRSHRAYHKAAAVASHPNDEAIRRARLSVDSSVQILLSRQPPTPTVSETSADSLTA